MKLHLRITTGAQRDVARIGQYLADIDVSLGLRFFTAFQLSVARLRQSTDLGEILPAGPTHTVEFRGWCVRDFERYVIFYRVLPDAVEVVRVLHLAQDAAQELND